MRIRTILLFSTASLLCAIASAQPNTAPRLAGGGTLQPGPSERADRPERRDLTPFDLDFPGGKPTELVLAIEKAMGRPLNTIVPGDFANIRLPALSMKHVTVPQLFQALEAVSEKRVGEMSRDGFETYTIRYGFQTRGTPSDDSVWYFFANRPVLPPTAANRICRFYALGPYLDRAGGGPDAGPAGKRLSVDDITTAIETGWKMLGDTNPPTMSFHKDTRLLIAVGEPSKLETIDAVLRALDASARPAQPAFVPRSEGRTPEPVPARPNRNNP